MPLKMASNHFSSHFTLHHLPNEVLYLILYEVDSLCDLKALIQTSKHIYRIFNAAKSIAISKVHANSLCGEAVEAALAVAYIRQVPSVPGADRDLLDHTAPASRLMSEQALTHPAWFRYHSIIEIFTVLIFNFCIEYARRRSWSQHSPKSPIRPISYPERARIQRALYRYEFYCALYSSRLDSTRVMSSTYWTANVTDWEMEELGCIHDIVFSVLASQSDVFEKAQVLEVVAPVVKAYNSYYKPPSPIFTFETSMQRSIQLVRLEVMAQGLGFVRDLLRTTEQAQRQQMVDRQRTRLFMSGPFSQLTIDPFRTMCALPPHRLKDLPFSDPNGPNQGWRWAHHIELLELPRRQPVYRCHYTPSSSGAYQERHATLRIWGYCFWDRERIEKWVAFKHQAASRNAPGKVT